MPLLCVACNDLGYLVAHRLHVLERAREEGYDIHVIGPPQPMPDRLKDKPYRFSFATVVRSSLAPLKDCALIAHYLRVFHSEKPQLVQAITIKPVLMAGIALHILRLFGGVRPGFVATVPGRGIVFAPDSQRTLAGRVRRRLVEGLYRLVAAYPKTILTFETEADRLFFTDELGVPKHKTRVMVGTGVDLAAFPATPAREGAFQVLFAGRLLRSKGIGVFVEAAELLKDHDDLEWLVAGWRDDNPESLTEDEIDALKQNRHLHFLGLVTDMPALFRQADALAMPTSYPEGIPRAMIEAFSSAIPVISSDFPGARALIAADSSGIILPETTPQALADAVLAIKSRPDRGKAMGMAGRARVEEGGFSEKMVQNSFMEAFSAAVSATKS